MDKVQIEEGKKLVLKYDANGLIPTIVQDTESGEILMMAYVNEASFQETLKSGYATFWSRSRQEIWKKGETSGNMMQIVDILVDCDQDCLIFKVKKALGGACHTKNKQGEYRESCFYRKIDRNSGQLLFQKK